jgi:hypothetical protein
MAWNGEKPTLLSRTYVYLSRRPRGSLGSPRSVVPLSSDEIVEFFRLDE